MTRDRLRFSLPSVTARPEAGRVFLLGSEWESEAGEWAAEEEEGGVSRPDSEVEADDSKPSRGEEGLEERDWFAVGECQRAERGQRRENSRMAGSGCG